MTNPSEYQPPPPTLAEFNEAVRGDDDLLVHRLAMIMLEDHFENSLRDLPPELWIPRGRHNYQLKQACVQEDGTPTGAGSTIEVSGRNPYVRRYRVSSYDAEECSGVTTAEWGKGDFQMMSTQAVRPAGRATASCPQSLSG